MERGRSGFADHPARLVRTRAHVRWMGGGLAEPRPYTLLHAQLWVGRGGKICECSQTLIQRPRIGLILGHAATLLRRRSGAARRRRRGQRRRRLTGATLCASRRRRRRGDASSAPRRRRVVSVAPLRRRGVSPAVDDDALIALPLASMFQALPTIPAVPRGNGHRRDSTYERRGQLTRPRDSRGAAQGSGEQPPSPGNPPPQGLATRL